MEYRGIPDLADDTRSFAEALPADIDLVVGIPRSGLLVANLLGLHLHVPLTDVDGLCNGRLLGHGDRLDTPYSFESMETVLVVDDTVHTGSEMTQTRERLAAYEFPFDLEFAAIYITPSGHEYVDHWSEVITPPRLFEWNILHHPMLSNACLDIDGILCRDPTPEENDDGERYREFLRCVEPNYIPDRRIGWLVTCRLETYREETEAWLERNGIEYDSLVMMDLPDKETRQQLGNHAEYKAEVYESTGASIFIESDPRQAARICDITNKSVFCYQTFEMIQPDRAKAAFRKQVEYTTRLRQDPLSFSAQVSKYLVSRGYHKVRRLVA